MEKKEKLKELQNGIFEIDEKIDELKVKQCGMWDEYEKLKFGEERK